MCTIPKITPLSNLLMATKVLKDLYNSHWDNKSIGQKDDGTGLDSFSYFFAIRRIPIRYYLESKFTVDMAAIGGINSYDYNIKSLTDYINYCVTTELSLIYDTIMEIIKYRNERLPIGEISLDDEPDYFLIFFTDRMLPIEVNLKGKIQIRNPDAYLNNIDTLMKYRKEVEKFLVKEKDK